MPAPPARMRSASVPCGLNSSSSSLARNWRSNSLFSPTYDEIILRICRVSSSRPRPKPSTPALFEMTVRSLGARIAQRRDQVLGDAAQAEAAGHHGHAVAHDTRERAARVSVNLGRWG